MAAIIYISLVLFPMALLYGPSIMEAAQGDMGLVETAKSVVESGMTVRRILGFGMRRSWQRNMGEIGVAKVTKLL